MIRKATPSDAIGIARVHVETWKVAYRGIIPQDFLDSLDEKRREDVWSDMIMKQSGTLWVSATPDDEVIGFCHFLNSRDDDADDHTGEITAIYISPTHWRKGLGGALCRCAIDFASKDGYQQITLWVIEENLQAIRFYESSGFEFDGTRKTEERPGFTLNELRYRNSISRIA